MVKRDYLIGLDDNEKSELGFTCRGFKLTPAQKKTATDAILAYRERVGGIVSKVGNAIARTLVACDDPISADADARVSETVDKLLRTM